MIYTAPTHNVLGACISITRGSGRGLGHGIREFLGPVKWHRADRRVPFGAQKTPSWGGRVELCCRRFRTYKMATTPQTKTPVKTTFRDWCLYM